MIRRAAFLALVATALLALQGADCFVPAPADRQAMACCHSMKCLPGQHAHQCCAAESTSHPQIGVPQESAALRVPAPGVAAHLALPVVTARAGVYGSGLGAMQHSPPDLYTLHASFLI
ncbi:MAG: hypothetical protein LAN59_05505 [Acidobacteriia bacterium]|nr:hypothetical protein [Terriglobia bacterium]